MARRIISVIIGLIFVGLFLAWTPNVPVSVLRDLYANQQSAFLTLPSGLNVHYRDEGDADASTLLLLHGSGASLHTWDPWVARLKDRYRIVRLDLPGHGLTGPNPSGDHRRTDLTEQVAAFIDAYMPERFTLVGHSLGGAIAWSYALEHQARLDGLVLVAASGLPLRNEGESISGETVETLANIPVINLLLTRITPRRLVRDSLYASVVRDDFITEDMVERYWLLLRHPGNRRAMLARLGPYRPVAEAERLGEIATPTLILWGRGDAYVPVDSATVFDEAIPDSQAKLYDTVGHLPHEEIPDRSAADLIDFLERRL